MLILALTALSLLVVPLVGGKLQRLSLLRLRRQYLVVTALLVQVLSISVFPYWPRPVLVAAQGASYLLAAAFVWANRRLPGVGLVAAGGFLNGFAIALNHGTMPASPSALRAIGIATDHGGFVNSGVVHAPRLAFLGDTFASPSWLPLRNVYSLGDLLILLGAVYAIHRSCRPARPQQARRPGEVAFDLA